jgi:hypothetical protein
MRRMGLKKKRPATATATSTATATGVEIRAVMLVEIWEGIKVVMSCRRNAIDSFPH